MSVLFAFYIILLRISYFLLKQTEKQVGKEDLL